MIPDLAEWLADREHDGLLRLLTVVEHRDGVRYIVNGRACINFCSNDYLGLADDPVTSRGARETLETWGCGAGASRLISGNLDIIHELEHTLAEWKQTEAALVFASGYMANVGVLTSLAGTDDTIFLDRLSHASLVDGARLSRARLKVFPHNDTERLDTLLAGVKTGEKLVVTESVFSMDGDTAPLGDLVTICKKHDAILIVDEAHALGVYGGGRGLVNECGLAGDVDVIIGTLSKALGSQGGFVAGSRVLAEYLVNTSRSFIYSTGLSPVSAGAALAALRFLSGNSARIEKLWYNISRFRSQMDEFHIQGRGPICPVIAGESSTALDLARRLVEEGYLVPAIRPPTVPAGSARIRVTLSAIHSEEQIDGLARAIHDVLPGGLT
jgi:8-amino-7-oxononanoate synthase